MTLSDALFSDRWSARCNELDRLLRPDRHEHIMKATGLTVVDFNTSQAIAWRAQERELGLRTMPFLDVTLKLSEEIACGLADGRYHLFGSVVRNNAGRVVTMLEPVVRRSARAARSNPKVALAALAVAGAAGAAVFVGSRFTRKARLTRELAKVDRTIQATLTEHPAELTRDDLRTIHASIDNFLTFTDHQRYEAVALEVPADARRMLIAFAEALRSFSIRLNALCHETEPVPELNLAPETNLLVLMKGMRAQLDYQARKWPEDNR